MFPYGNLYAEMVTLFGIVIVYCNQFPLVALAGLFSFSLRHTSHSFALLTRHKREIDSSSGMIQRIILVAQCCVLLFLLCTISFFFMNHRYRESSILIVTMIIALIYVYVHNTDFLDISEIDDYKRLFNESRG